MNVLLDISNFHVFGPMHSLLKLSQMMGEDQMMSLKRQKQNHSKQKKWRLREPTET